MFTKKRNKIIIYPKILILKSHFNYSLQLNLNYFFFIWKDPYYINVLKNDKRDSENEFNEKNKI